MPHEVLTVKMTMTYSSTIGTINIKNICHIRLSNKQFSSLMQIEEIRLEDSLANIKNLIFKKSFSELPIYFPPR